MNYMEQSVKDIGKLINSVRDFDLEKDVAKNKIKNFFQKCQTQQLKPVLYYTGHGVVGSGNWAFSDGTISIQEIENLVCDKNPFPIADCCYSGHWANYCVGKNTKCLSASPEFSTAIDDSAGGGELTQWMTGRRERPSTEPLFSGGTRKDYNADIKIDVTDFVSGHIQRTNKIVISQSMVNDRYNVIFADHKEFLNRARSWGTRLTFLSLVSLTNSLDQNVYSLASNNNHFSFFTLNNFGNDQEIIPLSSDSLNKSWDQGYMITSCCAHDSTFYVVMTKEAPGFGCSLSQIVRQHNQWSEIITEINKGYANGKIITGLCYSTGQGKYLLVMTESSCGQKISWDDFTILDGFNPTLIFQDPTDKKIMLVSSTDTNISGWIKRSNYAFK